VEVEILSGKARGTIGHVKAAPDSGAEGFFIGHEAMENIGLEVGDFSPAKMRITLADGSTVKSDGEIRARITLGEKHFDDRVILMGDSDGMLIPWYAMKEFGLLNPEYPDPPRREVQAATATTMAVTTASTDKAAPAVPKTAV